MDNKKIEESFRRGLFKTNRDNIRMIMSRTTDEKGRVIQGPAAQRLKEKRLERQKYLEERRK